MRIAAVTILAAGLAVGTYAVWAQQREPRPPRTAPPGVENALLARDAAEKQVLDVLDDLYKNQRRGMMNVPPEDGRMLRLLTEATGAKHVVEIGTSNGYSAIWICLALRTTGGRLTTHEIDAKRAELARANFKRAGVDSLVTLVPGDAHETVAKIDQPIDILFLDADKNGYADYLKKLLPRIRPGGLIVAHNTTSAAGQMADFLKAVTTNPELETVFDYTSAAGMTITLKKRPARQDKQGE